MGLRTLARQATLPISIVLVVSEKRVNLLYLGAGLSQALPQITEACDKRSLPTITHVVGYLTRGVAIAVTAHQDRPRIVVHLAASRRQGMRLHGSFLRLATVIR